MSKFNVIDKVKPDTVNRAGGEAYTETPEVALVNLLLTSFMKDKYYESAVQEQTRLVDLLSKVEGKFTAKAAIYARQKFGMRSITHGWGRISRARPGPSGFSKRSSTALTTCWRSWRHMNCLTVRCTRFRLR